MPMIERVCKCGNNFFVHKYRINTAKYCSRRCTGRFSNNRKGIKNPKGSLAKLGAKNPMWGKEMTEAHRKKIGEANKRFYINHPEKRLAISDRVKGGKSPTWVGDKVGRYGVHDWIKSVRGLAKYLKCEKNDDSCHGRLEWSNKSQEYKRRVDDWQVLCRSHHSRYDSHTHMNGFKTRFKKGQTPCNKSIKP